MSDPHVQIDDLASTVTYSVGSTPSTGPFTIPFPFFSAADITVELAGTALSPAPVGFAVTGTAGYSRGFPGGSVTLAAAVSNTTVRVYRKITIKRTSDFPLASPLDINTLNTEIDTSRATEQDLRRDLDSLDVTAIAAAVAVTAGDRLATDADAVQTAADRAAAEAARILAEAYAAGVHLPAVLAGDEFKQLVVKSDHSGYDLRDSAVSIAYPPPTSAFIRIASNGTAKQYLVSQYGGGNGLWVYSSVRSRFEFAPISGSYQTIDTTSCSINGVAAQAMLPNTTYYSYAMAPDTPGDFVKIDHSTTGYAGGDPNGASNITGWLYRSDGHLERRLIGAIHPDASSVIWGGLTRGVTHSGITTYYNRQQLQYQIPIAGTSGATSWGEIDSTQYIAAWLWGDGNEPSCVLAGQVSSDTSGATVSVGVSINDENPPYDFVDIYCAVSGKPYPFTVNVSSADYADEIAKFGVWMKNSSGNAGITNGRLKLHLSQ